jgi:hypothetical protein
MSFVGVSTDAYSLPPLLHQVNFKLVDNPLPRSRENAWEHDVRVLMQVEEKDPDGSYKRAKKRVEEARAGIKRRIAKFEMEITKKLVKSHAEDAPIELPRFSRATSRIHDSEPPKSSLTSKTLESGLQSNLGRLLL